MTDNGDGAKRLEATGYLTDLENILSIDLEEWYHPEYVKSKALKTREERVTESLNKTLCLLDDYNVNATFFIVGEIAEKHPETLEKISENGHEIAFHGYHHEPLWKLDAEILQSEAKKFGSLVKGRCIGFRAPSFSLNNETRWALKVIEDANYKYDSSVFPTKTPLYGVWGACPTRPYRPSYEDLTKEDENAKLWEFPLLVYQFAGLRVPLAGGFYLRFFPVNIVKRAIRKANKEGFPAVLFLHTWELDSDTPKLKLGPYKSFVTYYNLRETERKLVSILSDFGFMNFRNHVESL